MPDVLPCDTCGKHLERSVVNIDYALESKENLLNWLTDIRNHIYQDTNRPTKTVQNNIDEIFQNSSYYKEYLIIFLSVINIIFLVIILKMYK